MANSNSEDKQIVAQGSLEYNGQTIAYMVSKGKEYYIEISFIKGEKQNNKENDLKFTFEKKEDGKFYLNEKDAFYLHKVFIEEQDSKKSLVLTKDNSVIAKAYADGNKIGFVFKDKDINFLRGSKICFDDLAKKLGFVEGIKLMNLTSKFVVSFDKQITK